MNPSTPHSARSSVHGRRRRPARRGYRTALAAMLGVVLLLVGGAASADQLATLQSQRQDLEAQRRTNAEEQERLSAELEGTDATLQSLYLEISGLDGDISVAEVELRQAEEDLAAAERHRDSVADRLAVAEAEAATLTQEIEDSRVAIEQTNDDIGELARSTYRGGDRISTIAVVVEASSPEDFTATAFAVSAAMRSQGQVLDDLETEAALQRNSQARLDAVNVRIGELKVEAEAAVVAADEARQNAQDRRDELQRLRNDRANRAAELETYASQIQEQQSRIAADDADVAAQIQDLSNQEQAERDRIAREKAEREERERQEQEERERQAQAERDRQAQQGAGSANPAPVPPAAPPPANSGGSSSSTGLTPPVSAPFHVTSPFGMRTYPITGGRYMHNGTDIRSACGNAQYAAQSGTVVAVRKAAGNGTHGNQVLINHGVLGDGNSYVTVYNHLSRFAVSQGQSIGRGDVLGYTGMTGAVTGCHVHVEVWRNGSVIDPESLPGWNRSN